jgi:hypothetical protein
VKRKIFIGSSTEGFDKAEEIGSVLESFGGVEAKLWNKAFEPGVLTYDALEDVLGSCCAAVFVATPDLQVLSRTGTPELPRSNVLFEFGLMAGRLGLHNIALCRYSDVELPSDVKGLTVVDMDCKAQQAAGQLVQDPEEKLQLWVSRLMATPETIPRTAIFHGYTGRGRYELTINKWWDLEIGPPSFVQLRGILDLMIDPGGHVGSGLAQGRLSFNLVADERSPEKTYDGEYHIANRVSNVACQTDGALHITTEMFALQKMWSKGTPPIQLAAMDALPEPWSSKWTLRPTGEPGKLVGTICTQGTGHTEGAASITRD